MEFGGYSRRKAEKYADCSQTTGRPCRLLKVHAKTISARIAKIVISQALQMS